MVTNAFEANGNISTPLLALVSLFAESNEGMFRSLATKVCAKSLLVIYFVCFLNWGL